MDERKQTILDTIIREHIKTGAPVGSGVLVEKYKMNVSPATVRNDMAALEEEGFICQPHTSAGRVPTEKAYRNYLENSRAKLGKSDQEKIDQVLIKSDELSLKEAAKTLSKLSGNAVFWAFHRHNVYYTGISNLFQQPEFSQMQIIYDISAVIDRIDEIVDRIFDRAPAGVSTLLGQENPFGNVFGTVLIRYHMGDNDGICGIIGPMRMDYPRFRELLGYVSKKLRNTV